MGLGCGVLDGTRFWDAGLERLYRARGEPVADCVLQNRAEVAELCRFIESAGVRSYLEIGLWTGALLRLLQGIFRFEKVAGCDDGYCRRFGLDVRLPDGAGFFEGSSRSGEFAEWRKRLGHFDLVFVDADHRERAVRADFELQRRMPHRFLAFHDIASDDPRCSGVVRFWRSLDFGHRLEIVRPFSEPGLETKRMGIGIWSADEDPTDYLPPG